MAVLPITLLLLSMYCLGLRADQATCPTTISLEDRLAKIELLLNEVKDGQSDCIKCMMNTHMNGQNHTIDPISKGYKDCKAAYDAGYIRSGVHRIRPGGVNEVDVFCDQEIDGGGWTVFQRRMDGSQNFYRGWADYKKGFGKARGEYWIGNDNLNLLTADHNQTLKVELEYGGETVYANYSEFWIDAEYLKYKLHVAGASGDIDRIGDALFIHNGSPFSTPDRDNDLWLGHCARVFSGAWWYFKYCYESNLNGLYEEQSDKGIIWIQWKFYRSMSGVRMMMKPNSTHGLQNV